MQSEPYAAVHPEGIQDAQKPLPVPSSDHSTSGMSGSVVGDASTVASENRPPSPGVSVAASIDQVERQNPFENLPVDVVPSLSVSGSSETQSSLHNSRRIEIQQNNNTTSIAPEISQITLAGSNVVAPPLSSQVSNPEVYELSYQNPFPVNSTTSSEVDDEDTAPSSTNQRNPSVADAETKLQRLLETTKRRWENYFTAPRRDSEDAEVPGVLIAGYLQKLGRNGKWQSRWFETDGECLSYYKSSKRIKCLATLDLQKVGLIQIDPEDQAECGFNIQVLGRSYHLRADNRASCKDWVIMLNRVKEARLEQGNVKLIGPRVDLLDQRATTPRVVVVGYRDRTKAVDEEDQWDRIIGATTNPTIEPKPSTSLSTAVVARWSKRRTTMQRLGTKLSRWARSLKKYSCAELEHEKILLDRHVHPPGHDDKKRKAAKRPVAMQDRSTSNSSDYDARMLS